MSIAFRRGHEEADRAAPAKGLGRVLNMPSRQKHELAEFLMEHFGARNLTVKGDEYTHSCMLPFGHADNDPSASFNAEKLSYRCWGCGAGGLLWFVQAMTGLDKPAAVRFLLGEIETSGVSTVSDLLAFIEEALTPHSTYTEPIPRYDVRILDPWLGPTHPYLTEERGIPEENIVRMGVGHDTAKHRIVIPHFWDGSLVGWQSRRLRDDGTPKYLSTPGFPKDETLYNLSEEASEIVVVESPMTVVSKHHVGGDWVATFGAKVTDRQARILGRRARVILWMDNDPAGWNATESLIERISPLTDVRVVDSRWEQDAADLPDDEVERLLATTVPSPLWRRPTGLVRDYGTTRRGAT